MLSFPLRERGLKRKAFGIEHEDIPVVPLAGTWIETPYVIYPGQVLSMSFPLRERGLKLLDSLTITMVVSSFPLRERGLKQKDRRS